ncbi:ParA family protein [Photobacterium leiognathi]|uniref:ParA family protein n=1 Tax=Photobacterium leiognathi TaxID=553611 RepID=UPI000D16A986|nr:ParA family protein [Photobacterium leiognathi]PSW53051.1 ParA family protein [Photobacterium leiognathi subsp. mandapamensis]
MIISVAHQKGGVGKTTLTLSLQAVLNPDIIIDQDLHQSLIILNQLRDEPLPVHRCESRDQLIKLLKQSDQGKTILIDCGGFDSDINRLAVAASDLVIVPANDDVTELIGLRHFNQVLTELSAEMGQHITAHVLFNRVHPNRKKFDDVDAFLSHSDHMRRLNSIIPTRKDFKTATAMGLGVSECKQTKYSDACREIKQLGDEIAQLLKR